LAWEDNARRLSSRYRRGYVCERSPSPDGLEQERLARRFDKQLSDAHDLPGVDLPEDYPPEELSPELRRLIATTLVVLLVAVLAAGYIAIRVMQRIL